MKFRDWLIKKLGDMYDGLFGKSDEPWVIGNSDYKFNWGVIEWLCVTLIGLFVIMVVWIWLTK